MSEPRLVDYLCDSQLGIIHIQDGRGNYLNYNSLQQLLAAVERGIEDTSAKILLLRSGEESFCLGMDIQGLETSLERGSEESDLRREAVALYSKVLYAIYSCNKPVLALVEGSVKAGGIGLTSACDIVIASDDASFELSEVLFGLVPFNVLPYLFDYRCTKQRLRYLVLTASTRTAKEAQSDGLVDEVYSPEELEKRLKAIIKKMMRAEPTALALAKEYTCALAHEDLQTKRRLAQEAVLALMHSSEVQKAVEAFGAGSTPEWFGKFKPQAPISGWRRFRGEKVSKEN